MGRGSTRIHGIVADRNQVLNLIIDPLRHSFIFSDPPKIRQIRVHPRSILAFH
jgi:hypothetical protein